MCFEQVSTPVTYKETNFSRGEEAGPQINKCLQEQRVHFQSGGGCQWKPTEVCAGIHADQRIQKGSRKDCE